jgi:hypothetical protein
VNPHYALDRRSDKDWLDANSQDHSTRAIKVALSVFWMVISL